MEAPDRTVSLSLSCDVSSGRSARRAIQELLLDDVSIAVTRDAILLTSELVNNAVVHSRGMFRLRAAFSRTTQVLRVEVADSSPNMPVMPDMIEGRASRLGGLGLRLVDDVADSWGAEPTDTGKFVWFELSPPD